MAGNLVFEGIIVPQSWDEQGNAISIAISIAGEREYGIDINGKGCPLMNFIHHRIRLEGVMNPQKNKIEVSLFEVLDWA